MATSEQKTGDQPNPNDEQNEQPASERKPGSEILHCAVSLF
ncbi:MULTISPECIES: hypothetical protein [Enterobacterales]|jgi:hypothetical protein|nr:hypothetical protein [Escherichia coli]MDE4694312.1 hypothetical protein [Klebsiella pneumoniae]MDV0977939.1 hypothetical protein [Klebsiella pneumoniae]